jgi:hypothetical protein
VGGNTPSHRFLINNTKKKGQNHMALCDFIISEDIQGYDCENPMVKGAKADGLIINRSDINLAGVTYDSTNPFKVTALPLNTGKTAYDIVQGGKTPYTGTQQEMQEGTYQNTITNTVQFVILNHGNSTAQEIFALMNGEFVVVLQNNNNTYQVFGLEAGLRASAMVRELYNDDTLAGWLVTMTEENAAKGNLFIDSTLYETLKG